jgi:hypothetical protein
MLTPHWPPSLVSSFGRVSTVASTFQPQLRGSRLAFGASLKFAAAPSLTQTR